MLQPLSDPPPTELGSSRIQLHWAAQIVSALADRWLPAKPDDSHTSMAWQGDALVGGPTPSGLQLALVPRRLELQALRDGRSTAALALAGTTLAAAMRWADEMAAAAEGEPPRGMRARDYDMPDHPVRSAVAAFSDEPAALAALASWFAFADSVLREIARGEPAALPVRIWPHHFDTGSIVFVDPPGPTARQIGFGMSPGDHYYEQPYFYVTAYPMRPEPRFPPLAAGFWREQPPFVGAVLLGESLTGAADPHATARSFLVEAIAAAHRLLG